MRSQEYEPRGSCDTTGKIYGHPHRLLNETAGDQLMNGDESIRGARRAHAHRVNLCGTPSAAPSGPRGAISLHNLPPPRFGNVLDAMSLRFYRRRFDAVAEGRRYCLSCEVVYEAVLTCTALDCLGGILKFTVHCTTTKFFTLLTGHADAAPGHLHNQIRRVAPHAVDVRFQRDFETVVREHSPARVRRGPQEITVRPRQALRLGFEGASEKEFAPAGGAVPRVRDTRRAADSPRPAFRGRDAARVTETLQFTFSLFAEVHHDTATLPYVTPVPWPSRRHAPGARRRSAFSRFRRDAHNLNGLGLHLTLQYNPSVGVGESAKPRVSGLGVDGDADVVYIHITVRTLCRIALRDEHARSLRSNCRRRRDGRVGREGPGAGRGVRRGVLVAGRSRSGE
ncbi:hypothetical protein EVAR_102713_1 [Eumeta japonica]|uniref:Uncharacterized protein n=1 Tax=Eumeta variegata TaxID=151549 RepID=A0A4C1TKQ4_EUMVA|nr:hypothetical protein EVAR_102713_1 [Eumeta japonica]